MYLPKTSKGPFLGLRFASTHRLKHVDDWLIAGHQILLFKTKRFLLSTIAPIIGLCKVVIMTAHRPIPAPLSLHREKVRQEWIDYNGHLNMGFYLLAFDHATDAFLDYIGLGEEYASNGDGTTFSLEAHVSYLAEVRHNDLLRFETYVFDFDEKRIHYAHAMYHDTEDYLASTNELVTLHVNRLKRRSAPMPSAVLGLLSLIKTAHITLEKPPGMSRRMGLKPHLD